MARHSRPPVDYQYDICRQEIPLSVLHISAFSRFGECFRAPQRALSDRKTGSASTSGGRMALRSQGCNIRPLGGDLWKTDHCVVKLSERKSVDRTGAGITGDRTVADCRFFAFGSPPEASGSPSRSPARERTAGWSSYLPQTLVKPVLR